MGTDQNRNSKSSRRTSMTMILARSRFEGVGHLARWCQASKVIAPDDATVRVFFDKTKQRIRSLGRPVSDRLRIPSNDDSIVYREIGYEGFFISEY